MGWKNWPYFFKGGIMFSLISLVTGFILSSSGGEILLILTHGIAALPFILLYTLFDWQASASKENLLITLFATITYFILGSIIGWIYGKIKNRK